MVVGEDARGFGWPVLAADAMFVCSNGIVLKVWMEVNEFDAQGMMIFRLGFILLSFAW